MVLPIVNTQSDNDINTVHLLTDARIMKTLNRDNQGILFTNDQHVSNSIPKLIVDLPDHEHCALWCVQNEKCYHFQHIPNTRGSPEGVCTIYLG